MTDGGKPPWSPTRVEGGATPARAGSVGARPKPRTATTSLWAMDATVPRYPRRFRWRVIRSILFVSFLAAAVAFGYSYLRQSRFGRQDRHARGDLLAQTFAESVDFALIADDPTLAVPAVQRLLAASDVVVVEVYRLDGSRLLRKLRAGGRTAPAPTAELVARLKRATRPATFIEDGEERDDYFAPVLAPGGDAVSATFGRQGASSPRARVIGFVRISVSHAQQERRQSQMLRWSVSLAGGLVILGLVLALLVGWRLSRPILKLAAGADAIRRGKLDVQVSVRSHDEIGQLADSFNRMVWKLRTTLEQLGELNRNLEGEVAERTRDIRRMADFLEILNARRDLGHLARDALRALVEGANGVMGAIYLYNEQAVTLSIYAAHGADPSTFGAAVVKLGEGFVGNAAQEADPVVIVDEGANQRLSEACGKTLHTVVYQRIRFGESLAGVVVVGTETAMSERRLEALVQATHPLAIAMANAKAFGAAERLAQELDARNRELIEQTELLARQKAQLEEVNRLKSELMANITHELRTPLNAVIGYADLMQMGAYGDLNEEQQESIGAIVESARGLLDLITQILDMAKMEAGQMALVVSEVDVGKLLRDAAQTAQVLARGRPIQVGLGLPEGEVLLRTDEGKLRQVVTNLVSNAVKFTESGRVDLLCAVGSEGALRLVIRDTGVGISPEHYDVIFDEFRQLDGSTTRAAMGTGLGLAISRKFIRLMGGEIAVESQPGHGSTFTVYLPAKPPRVAVDADSEAALLDDASQALGLAPAAGGGEGTPGRVPAPAPSAPGDLSAGAGAPAPGQDGSSEAIDLLANGIELGDPWESKS